MAAWQYDLDFVPRAWLDEPGSDLMLLASDVQYREPWQKWPVPVSEAEAVLERHTGSPSETKEHFRMYGTDLTDRFDLAFTAGLVDFLSVRVYAACSTLNTVGTILAIASELGLSLVTRWPKTRAPNVAEELLRLVRASPAMEWVHPSHLPTSG